MPVEIYIDNNPEVITRLAKTVQEKHCQAHPAVFAPFDEKTYLPWYQEKLKQANVTGVLARMEGKDIGYALVFHQKYGPEVPFIRAGHEVLLIDQMSIEPAFQNKGIGKAMLQFVVDLAKQKNIPAVQLGVWSDNAQALKSYQDFGFQAIRQVLEVKS